MAAGKNCSLGFHPWLVRVRGTATEAAICRCSAGVLIFQRGDMPVNRAARLDFCIRCSRGSVGDQRVDAGALKIWRAQPDHFPNHGSVN